MALYLISFNDEWVPELTPADIQRAGTAARAVIAEMESVGEFVFGDGGLDASTVVCSVEASEGAPVFTDGPFIETKEQLMGFWIIEAANLDEALAWTRKAPLREAAIEVRPLVEEEGEEDISGEELLARVKNESR